MIKDISKLQPKETEKNILCLWRLQALLAELPKVVVAGIASISRAVMNRAKDGSLQLFAEGTDLRVRSHHGLGYSTLCRTAQRPLLGVAARRAGLAAACSRAICVSAHGNGQLPPWQRFVASGHAWCRRAALPPANPAEEPSDSYARIFVLLTIIVSYC